MIRQVVFILMLGWPLQALAQAPSPDVPKAATRPPADIPFARLTPDAVVPLALEPGAVESADGVWIPNRDRGSIVRVDAKDNRVGAPIVLGVRPCASLAVAFDSIWVPMCGDRSLVRVEAKAPRVAATLTTAVANADGRIATGIGSVWAITDRKGIVSRIDPDTNASVAEIHVAGGATAVAFNDDTLWITSEDGPSTSLRASPSTPLRAGTLTRVNPHNNEIVEVIEVGPRPGRLAVGEGGVWTLNRGNGGQGNTVTRVDPATNQVVATITVGDGVADGEIAAGLGSVWISAPGVPLVRIDPRTNRAVQRFTGAGGGAVLVAHGSLWVAAGPQATWRLDPMLVATIRP